MIQSLATGKLCCELARHHNPVRATASRERSIAGIKDISAAARISTAASANLEELSIIEGNAGGRWSGSTLTNSKHYC